MNVRLLSKPLQEKAIRELNEEPSRVEEYLLQLKTWLQKQEHLKYKNDDQFLLNFLRGSKYSLERTKSKLDSFYTFRTLAPDIACNWNPLDTDIQNHLKSTTTFPLPTPKNDPSAPRVMFCSYAEYDPDETTFSTILRGEAMGINILINEDDNFVVSGAILIWDFKGYKLQTALQTTPTIMKKVVLCFVNAYPTRLKKVVLINTPPFFVQVLNAIKLLISHKITERIHFYSSNNLETLFQHIPKSIFPTEYGGDAGTVEQLRDKWKKNVEDHHAMFADENNYYSIESRRPEMSYNKIEDYMFGTDGTFKNLQVD